MYVELQLNFIWHSEISDRYSANYQVTTSLVSKIYFNSQIKKNILFLKVTLNLRLVHPHQPFDCYGFPFGNAIRTRPIESENSERRNKKTQFVKLA